MYVMCKSVTMLYARGGHASHVAAEDTDTLYDTVSKQYVASKQYTAAQAS
jgi:hypothetical protein